MNTHSHLDTDLLSGYLESLGKSVVEQMIELYQQQSQIYMRDIHSAAVDENQKEWQSHCHKMKGAAASVGLLNVHQTLASVEKSEVSKQEKLAIMADIETKNESAVSAFKQWLAN